MVRLSLTNDEGIRGIRTGPVVALSDAVDFLTLYPPTLGGDRW